MQGWWQPLSPTLKGTWLMVLSVLAFTVLLILIRMVGQGVSVFFVVVFRQAVMQAIILLQAGPRARTILRTENLRLQLWRSVLALASTVSIYVSFIYLPLALASAISFSAVLFVTLGAVIFLKEKVDTGTWIATLIGLVGVFIMLSPREGGDMLYVLVAIAGAIVTAGTILTVRFFHPSETIGTVLTYQGVLVLPVLLVPTILTWQQPSPLEWGLLALIGLVSTLGHYSFVAAYRYAEAARLAPIDFLRLVLLSLAGLVFFNEHLEPTLLLGMAIVIITTFYTIRSNSRAARRQASLT